MATITAPSASQNYSIDATEVTKGQYDLWLGTKPALPASTDTNCGGVTSYTEQGTGYTGADSVHHPIVYVDWCDAYAYCQGVGKRLCGKIGGGPNLYADFATASLSQWYNACSSGGANSYPYLGAYQTTACNGTDLGKSTTTVVGSLSGCQASGLYAGAYDLSGNVWEWEDSCSGTGQTAICRFRGGSFYDSGSNLPCGGEGYYPRDSVYDNVGFRCCSP